MKSILVTGGKGQLANCIIEAAKSTGGFNFIYVDIDELDITNAKAVNSYFKSNKITHCINCAAFTAVDKAESNVELAKSINVDGAKNLATACSENNAILIHISTDFVFDGKQSTPYSEVAKESPLNIYGLTKLNGEKAIRDILKQNFIIRTSWLYSEHGHNFLTTMLRLGREKDILSVVSDQIGTPTYAMDLAKVLMTIINKKDMTFGTFHYSNEGVASWYDFAKAIFNIAKINIEPSPIKTEAYPTPAKRPSFSVMDKSKIKKELSLQIPYWRDSLEKCIKNIKLENKTKNST